MSVIVEFLEFIEQPRQQSLKGLLGRVLNKAREITGAEAGTIFIRRRRGASEWLEARSVQNERIRLNKSDFRIPLDPASIAGFVATSGETVIIDDLYDIPGDLPFSFDRTFDITSGYRSRSMLAFPLVNLDRKVIGVVQLINRRVEGTDQPQPFTDEQADLILPFNHIVGRVVEQAEMVEQIRTKNAALRSKNKELIRHRKHIENLQSETEDAFMLSIQLLARAAEIHDEGTGNHIVRVNEYSHYIAVKLGLSDKYCETIRFCAQLHDVGKMSVNTAILTKAGALDEDERVEMDRHTSYGHQILAQNDRLQMAADIAIGHHEKWDGSGYPNGLAGEDIPLSARIVAMADIYDALRAERHYKPAFSHEKTYAILTEGDDRIDPSTHFDPAVAAVFRENHNEFERIWNRLAD
ncbi:MAG: HD domain-containing protein [Alphaproteobacteria bacterium]|jgi:HD-GYP domain-containing protein (c-di-GMP phosphodiesterase class II)|nr:HD domain-containing protein [Alphaproteobacteria bacterium]